MMRAIMPKSVRPATAARPPADVDERARRIAAIVGVVHRIPSGRVTTYGAVAARAGLPRQARLVGKVLSGSPARGRQISRLRAEGIDASSGRVDLVRHGWGAAVGDLDQLLWSGE
jgi:methylated-DNA-protein-cysteine methyltransferase-like protein